MAEEKSFIFGTEMDLSTRESFAEIYKYEGNDNIWHEIWLVINNGLSFTSTVYMSGDGVNGVSQFKSKGKFTIINDSGDVQIDYVTSEAANKKTQVLDTKKIIPYLSQAGRDNIYSLNINRTIYSDEKIKIIKRMQSGEFILFTHAKK